MKVKLLIALVAFGLGAALTRVFAPKIEQQTVVEERIVERVNIRTITKIVERPDGSKETVTEVIDKTKVLSTNNTTDTKFAKSDWLVGITAGSKLTEFAPIYGLNADRRIIGPVFAGAYGRTDGELGLSVKMEF